MSVFFYTLNEFSQLIQNLIGNPYLSAQEIQSLSSDLKLVTAEKQALQIKEKRIQEEKENNEKEIASRNRAIEDLQREKQELQSSLKKLADTEQDLRWVTPFLVKQASFPL